MNGDDLNHYVNRGHLDTALITGGSIRTLCGVWLEPELRVGSSGKADAPELDPCRICEEMNDLRERRDRALDEWADLSNRLRGLIGDARVNADITRPKVGAIS